MRAVPKVKQILPQALCHSPRTSLFQLTHLMSLGTGHLEPMSFWVFLVRIDEAPVSPGFGCLAISFHRCLLMSGVWPSCYTGVS